MQNLTFYLTDFYNERDENINSKERHEARYQRRKAKRDKKKKEFIESLGTYEEIFSFENLYESFKKCKKGVRWKNSIQSYEVNLPTNIYELWKEINDEIWTSKGFVEFDLCERGKLRHIQSVHISERCLQRCFCDNYLVPLLSHNLIYDNGASLKSKGIDFAIRRIKKHLQNYYNTYHTNKGYVLLFDFSNYFRNISHDKLFEITDKYMTDERLKALYHQLVNAFDEGLGLGSQVCQISAIAFPNIIDHYFKDILGIKGYARYMDDGYIIGNNINDMYKYRDKLYELCNELGIIINPKKIVICRIEHGFIFLKKRIRLIKNRNVVVKLSRKSLASERRKLKKLYKMLINGKIQFHYVEEQYRSWRGNALKYKNYKSVSNMDKLYNSLFIKSFARGENYYG